VQHSQAATRRRGRTGNQGLHGWSNATLFWLAAAVLITLVALSQSAHGASQGQPRINLPRPEWDFGTVTEGAKLTRTFPVENAGGKSLEIRRVRGSCKCFTKVSVDKDTLEPGERATITVETDTKGRRGKLKKYIYIESNDPANPRARIRITGFIEHAEGDSRESTSPAVEIAAPKPVAKAKAVCITYFHSSTCEECAATRKALEKLEKTQRRVAVRLFEIDDLDSYALMLRMEKEYGRIEHAPPIIYVGTTLLDGWDEVHAKLGPTVSARLDDGQASQWPPEVAGVGNPDSSSFALVLEKFRTIGPLAIAGAGLVDGINPCAFATIVFFISLLARFGKSRRQIAVVGVCFTLAVFVTYFLLGLGIARAIQAFSVSIGIAKGITYAIAALAAVLGLYSLYDYLVWRRDRSGADMKLKLPRAVQRRIHDVMRSGLSSRKLVIAALATGCAISVLESICTGQVYLPTIVFVLRDAALRLHALGYLVLYNVMFILPLVVIFMLVYFGLRSASLARLAQRHTGTTKLLLTAVFFGLAVLLFATT